LTQGTVEDVLAATDQARTALAAFATLERLPQAWKLNGVQAMSPFSLTAIHMLLRDEPSACRLLVETFLLGCRQEGAVCEQYRRFERTALARMSREAPALLEQAKEEARHHALPAPPPVWDRLLRRVSKLPRPTQR
jgi:hypothetical protein